MAAHTPGPWERDRRGQLRGSDGNYVVVWDAGIAWGARSTVTEANARLIAAAPELLDALLTLVEQRGAHFHTATAWDHARAAIAKTEGRS
ncbi:hypothetical protein [uncultured Enterovirga sp.]|uniref:hypothetical protein n=1 Tax=uncultured Enterovirga sp. TaxID=2026352 RepID=UPI0035CB182A